MLTAHWIKVVAGSSVVVVVHVVVIVLHILDFNSKLLFFKENNKTLDSTSIFVFSETKFLYLVFL